AAIRGRFLVSNQALAFRQEAIHCISPFCSRRLVAARQRQYYMSNSPDTGLDLEELELQLLPAWAKQSPDTNRFAKYEGGQESGPRGRDGGANRARMPG